MKDTLESYVQSYLPTNSTKILEKIDWNMWLFEVGMPRNVNTEFINPQIQSALNLANYYVDHQESPANKSEYKSYILDLRIIFMKQLIGRLDTLTDKALRLIDSDFNVTQSEANPEVLVPWLRLMISKRCFEANGRAKLFLSGIGRQKYLVPIYTAYAQADKATGLKYYNEFRYKYHPIAQRRIDLIFAAAESE